MAAIKIAKLMNLSFKKKSFKNAIIYIWTKTLPNEYLVFNK